MTKRYLVTRYVQYSKVIEADSRAEAIKFSGRTEREALIAGEYPPFVS